MIEPNDPPRLSDGADTSPLGNLLRGARSDVPTQAELSQLSLRLGATLGVGAVVAVAARGSGLFAKFAAGAAISAAAVGAWVVHAHHAADVNGSGAAAQASAPVRPSALSVAAPAVAPSPEPVVVPAPVEPALGAEPSVQAPKAAVTSAKPAVAVDEAGLLERARSELATNPAAALAVTNEHLARFPRGVLAQEREVIAIAALRKLGRSAEADRRAAAFAGKYPDSAHKRAVTSEAP